MLKLNELGDWIVDLDIRVNVILLLISEECTIEAIEKEVLELKSKIEEAIDDI